MNKLTDKIFIQTGKSALDSLLTNVTPQNTQGTGGGAVCHPNNCVLTKDLVNN